jgi:LAGLIDADG endonuclease
MFVWTTIESEHDGGFVAGLIAGDGYFSIRPNNSGATWQCILAVRLRADDTPLLARLRRWSGVGALASVPARATSRPQTSWTVQRQADCLRIVSILDRHPLLGKKLGEYQIWREAVGAWAGRSSRRHSVIAECHDRLRAYRQSDNVAGPSQVSLADQRLWAFLAGFATAEAHFGATLEGHPFFVINLRHDDGEILRLFRNRLGIGQLVEVPPYRTSRAALSWRIAGLHDLRLLTRVLDGYPPRGRVLRIYEAWRELVLLRERRSGRRKLLAARVKKRRAYKPGLEKIVKIDALAQRRARHVAVLKEWAAATNGPRTVTAYETWRRGSGRKARSAIRSPLPSGPGRPLWKQRASAPRAAGQQRSTPERAHAPPPRGLTAWPNSAPRSSRRYATARACLVGIRVRRSSLPGETSLPLRFTLTRPSTGCSAAGHPCLRR